MIYNLIVAVSLRSRAYLYDALYLGFILLTAYFAFADELFPAVVILPPWLNSPGEEMGLAGALLAYLIFGRSFLDTRHLTPGWDYMLRGWSGFASR